MILDWIRVGTVLHELWTVQRLAYAVEAELIGFDGIPGLLESKEDLQATHHRFLGFYDDEGLAGAMAFVREGSELDICRLVVHPRAHRRGIASKLLDALDPADRTIVSTGTKMSPRFGCTASTASSRQARARWPQACPSPSWSSPPVTGRVIFLNGTSSSGKSSIAEQLLLVLDTPYFHLSVDAISGLRAVERTLELDGPEQAAVLRRTRAGFHRAVAGMAQAGNDVVVDHVLSEPWRAGRLPGSAQGPRRGLRRCPLPARRADAAGVGPR